MTVLKSIVSGVLYAALALGAIPASATNLEDLRVGDMRKLVFHADPAPAPLTKIMTADGQELDLSAFEGKIVLLNFWATWCAPCREEMPYLDELSKEFAGEDFEVVAVATGRNPVPLIEKFFEREGVKNLTIYRDPKQELARAMSIFGLPVTVILDRKGKEIARMRGDAHWASEDAKTLLRAIISQ